METDDKPVFVHSLLKSEANLFMEKYIYIIEYRCNLMYNHAEAYAFSFHDYV